jgi:hypothetical protein
MQIQELVRNEPLRRRNTQEYKALMQQYGIQ